VKTGPRNQFSDARWKQFKVNENVIVKYLDIRETTRIMDSDRASPAETLGMWVPIPLEAWMSVCVYSVCAVLCVGCDLATG
jgi:hypothetical protein